ncbi:PHP domain-containing protein [Caldinitratiruptor microaerophilus]|uniref:Phosphoesterase n=1 Tax=Caldinitratiruptor microaerophilus TaxID=671077 RepID=A0AA35G922_9FIRM|nr:PHP domain-containing protein [Caldinitratiruptor microaerophilus]BDG61670.1 phosphoesterase [Caldinitratiruptor microaerophilus]
MEIVADYHTHTRYSHGRGTVEDNVRAALARGLEAVGIADHGPRSWPWIRATADGLRAMQRDVARVRARVPGLRVLAGVEANVVTPEGDLDVPADLLSSLDLVIVALHPTVLPPTLRDAWRLLGPHYAARGWPSPRVRARAREVATRALVQAVLRHSVDIVAHPGWGFDVDTRELARACAGRGTALELSAGHEHMTVEYCRIAAREGALFSLGSDAHAPERVGDLDRAVALARAAGVGPEQVVGARGGPDLPRRAAAATGRPAGRGGSEIRQEGGERGRTSEVTVSPPGSGTAPR